MTHIMSNAVSPLERLPLDVRDRLLTSLSSFESLRAAVLSCKALYEAYSLRKHSVFNAVVENESGPALLEALAVSRAITDLEEHGKEDEIIDLVADRDGPLWRSEVSVEDAYEVGDIAQVASELEDLFSFRYKDRTKTTSALSYSESCVFRRALYQNWFLSLLCRASSLDDNDVDDDEEIDNGIDEATSSSFVQVISDLDDKSLSAFYQVLLFLDELYARTYPRQSYNATSGMIVMSATSSRLRHFSPLKIIGDFKEQTYHPNFDFYTRASEALATGLDNLLSKRKVNEVFEGKYKKQAVLDGVSNGYAGQCHKCHKATAWLYNDTCWSDLSEHIPVQLLTRVLPGRLSYNQSACNLLNPYVQAPDFYHRFMEDAFASLNDPASSWLKDEWVCGDCVVHFIKQELFSWFVRQLIHDGHAFKANCWYGFDCRTQRHNPVHAEKLNHLCEPDPSKTDGN
ncbi:hypothetical protein SCHPADRAFT_1000186 [Schizopora paradoxa]|uniref:Uncharacterized protein n=1 Tax=Schizopora paradoxa TaxID=27342 RepID=A0A0H2RXS0_9AGAM|nr:hypothetical protein SCHPADRAFT_1000186 [Schizopora paradoxa]